MSRPAVEVADILHAQGDTFLEQHPWLSVQQRSVLRAIARCRTAALGGHLDRCGACGHQAISYNSCRNRHCPKCQAQARERWLARARARAARRAVCARRLHAAACAAAARPIGTRASVHLALSGERGDAPRGRRRPATSRRGDRRPEHPPHVGADPGPPSARALRRAGRRAVARSSALDSPEVRRLLPAREGPQSRVSRQVCRGATTRVRPRRTRPRRRAPSTCATRRSGTPSSTRSSRPTGSSTPSRPSVGASAVLRYLGRYTHRVAISNHRLLAFDGERVTFRWKDYAHDDQWRTMTLTAMEFLRRFVQHVLPRGFVRIRQSGYLASACRTARLALARTLARARAARTRRDRRRATATRLAHVGLSAVRRADDHRPDPLGAPARHGHASASTPHDRTRARHDRRPRRRGRPRLGDGVPRSRRAQPVPSPERRATATGRARAAAARAPTAHRARPRPRVDDPDFAAP